MRQALLLIALIVCTKVAGQSRVLGADLSLLPAYEDAGTVYYAQNGRQISDVLQYVKDECGFNAVRVRLFVGLDGSDPSVVQDLDYVKRFGKRIKDAGMGFLLDFHYSDTWADPGSQSIPAGWDSSNDWYVEDSLYKYTKRCLSELSEIGALPDYVQIGNEISYGMLWREEYDKVYPAMRQSDRDWQWERLAKFLKSAAKAVREIASEAKIIVHTERVAEPETTVNFYSYLDGLGVDYDIVGLSYYPMFQGSLEQLGTTLDRLGQAFPNKKVQIVETAYNYAYYPADATFDFTDVWQATPEGQQAFAEALVKELNRHDNVNGLYWWFAEENGSGRNKKVINAWLNRGLWNNNTGRALPALYKLKGFLDVATSLPANPTIDKSSKKRKVSDNLFDPSGRKVRKGGRGFYIGAGGSIIL